MKNKNEKHGFMWITEKRFNDKLYDDRQNVRQYQRQ